MILGAICDRLYSMNTFAQKLDLRQSQNLVMTPQLQQAIHLLQLNNVELEAFLEEELEKNPLLEKDERVQADQESADDVLIETAPDVMDEAFQTPDSSEVSTNDFDAGSSDAVSGAGGNTSFDIADEQFENRMSTEKSLREYLTEQLRMCSSDPRDQAIGTLLIDRLDESGYLRDDVDTLPERLGCSADRIEDLLYEMKQFDPTGIFARDLSECLALQLEEQGKLDKPMRLLLDNLNMLGDHDFKGLAALCDVNDTYLMDMVAEIKELNPKPASTFDHVVVQTAVPDVLMKKLPKNLGGGWRVELNQDTLPKVLVNQIYYTQVSKGAVSKQDREYVSNQMASASWLVRALDQRAQTIIKVAGELVAQQDAFFNYGIEFLKPMTLKDIATEIDMHESTVSRVTTNKYIGTPRGLFELKFFFTTGLQSASGVVHSAESIKARIKSLIDAEEPTKILSDDKLVTILKDEGIDLARRTVAKYREAMHIGSSVQRRKQKKNLAYNANM